MSLDVYLTKMMPTDVYTSNITHNLGKMAGIVHYGNGLTLYDVLWRPDEKNLKIARELIPYLNDALLQMLNEPDEFKKYNPENGWGSYEGLLEFVRRYRNACEEYPDAEIGVSR